MSAFVLMLKSLLHKRFKSRRQFVLVAEPDRPLGGSGPALHYTLTGRTPPPLHTVPKWSKALGLDGPEAERFMLLAVIAHLPAEWQGAFEQMIDRIERLERLERITDDPKEKPKKPRE